MPKIPNADPFLRRSFGQASIVSIVGLMAVATVAGCSSVTGEAAMSDPGTIIAYCSPQNRGQALTSYTQLGEKLYVEMENNDGEATADVFIASIVAPKPHTKPPKHELGQASTPDHQLIRWDFQTQISQMTVTCP